LCLAVAHEVSGKQGALQGLPELCVGAVLQGDTEAIDQVFGAAGTGDC